MRFLELAKLLHDERNRHFGKEPIPRPLSSTLSKLVEAYETQFHVVYPDIAAAVRNFARNKELVWNSIEEKFALQYRFDFAIAVLLFLASLRTQLGVQIVRDPDPSIPEEDLIEWALLATFNYELHMLDEWTFAKVQERVEPKGEA